MRRSAPLFALLFLLLGLPLGAAAQDDGSADALQWMEKMVSAVKTLNYEGTFVYAHDWQLETMHVIHAAGPKGERERLISLNGSPREVLRDDQLLTCILPDKRVVMVEKAPPPRYIPAGLLNLSKELRQHYRFKLAGQDRVAGRDAQIVHVEPRDGYRYGYRLWLDQDTGMLLKSDLVNEKGMPVEQMMFTRLTLHETIPESRLKPAISGKGFTWYRQEQPPKAPAGGGHQWEVTKLPPGFHMSMHMEHAMPESRMPVDHLMYTDGLASVSVYIESLSKAEKPFKGVSRMGGVNAFGTMIEGHQVTVVGEVPKSTVMLIGEAVRMKLQKGAQ